jgi:hypothetical protein
MLFGFAPRATICKFAGGRKICSLFDLELPSFSRQFLIDATLAQVLMKVCAAGIRRQRAKYRTMRLPAMLEREDFDGLMQNAKVF